MKEKKQKLTAQDIVDFFLEKPTFDKSQTDAYLLYGWCSTRGGLYSITDLYKFFEAKEFEKKDVDEVIHKFFQKQDAFSKKMDKMEKGKTHNIFLYRVFNHNPDYKSYFSYYLYDITKEEADKLKLEYEAENLNLINELIAKKRNIVKTTSAAKKAKTEKKTRAKSDKPKVEKPKVDKPKVPRKPRAKKELVA